MYKGEEKVAELIAHKGSLSIEQIATALGISIDSVRKFAESLLEQGYVSIKKEERERLIVTDEFRIYKEKNMLPEFAVFKKAADGKSFDALDESERKYGIGWAKKKGYVEIEQGMLKPLKSYNEVEEDKNQILSLFDRIVNGERPEPELLDELFTRGFIKADKISSLILTWLGKDIPKEVRFDLSTEGPNAPIGKPHPLTILATKIKQIFIELGFEEMDGSIVESTFWNFDALFQPQDHPARDLADTFYLFGKTELPDKKIVNLVKKAHEDGWKYKWSEEESRRRVLRTHTTALSARALAALKTKEPKKYFSIGKVFRNEATDATHLTEFYQVEGIVVWEKATFRNLLGILKEFYRRLGFEKIRFRPSYFPYTEPSLEVEVYLEKRKAWLEMGGAGIFRPEVSIPLANIYPVLAWGLSLERPLMLLLDISDVRTIYKNEMKFLTSARL